MKPSELKKLAKACREAGIKHFKNAEIEFTLSDDYQADITRHKAVPLSQAELEKPIESDDLSQSAMLFWSTGDDFADESKAS